MGEVRFMISEAAKQVHVESHVLRYWEEELNLKIGRTEMGHRYYTEDDIQLFLCIRKLKNEGMLLRDLKPLIPQLTATRKKLTDAVHAEDTPEQTSDTMENTSNRRSGQYRDKQGSLRCFDPGRRRSHPGHTVRAGTEPDRRCIDGSCHLEQYRAGTADQPKSHH